MFASNDSKIQNVVFDEIPTLKEGSSPEQPPVGTAAPEHKIDFFGVEDKKENEEMADIYQNEFADLENDFNNEQPQGNHPFG